MSYLGHRSARDRVCPNPRCRRKLEEGMFFPNEGGVWLNALKCYSCARVWKDPAAEAKSGEEKS